MGTYTNGHTEGGVGMYEQHSCLKMKTNLMTFLDIEFVDSNSLINQ